MECPVYYTNDIRVMQKHQNWNHRFAVCFAARFFAYILVNMEHVQIIMSRT